MDTGRPHVSQVQKEYLLNYLLENPRLTYPKFSSDFTVKQAQIEWQALAAALNRLPGSVKDWKQWRKTWHDLKSKTKMRYKQQGSDSLNKEEKLVIKISAESNNNLLPSDEDVSEEYNEGTINLDKYFEFSAENQQENTGDVRNISENIIIEIIPSEDQEDDENFAKSHGATSRIKDEEGATFMDVYSRSSVRLDRQSFYKKKPRTTSSYHSQKLYHLNRIARAKERSAEAKIRIAEALEKMSF